MLTILNDGRDSDLSSLLSDICTEERFPDNEFQHLLNDLGNEDVIALLNDIDVNNDDDEEENRTIEVDCQ